MLVRSWLGKTMREVLLAALMRSRRALCSVEGFRPSFWQCLGFQLGNHRPRPRASKLDKGRTCCTANQEFSQKAFPYAHVLGCEMHFCMLLAAFRFRLNNRSCSASLWRDFRLALVLLSGICTHSKNEEGNSSDKIFRNVALQVKNPTVLRLREKS